MSLMNRAVRGFLRRRLDSLFCDSGAHVERIGIRCVWTIVPSLGADTLVLSGGAGGDISFEEELVDRFGCRVAVFDPSPTGRLMFSHSRAQRTRSALSFHDQGLAAESGLMRFSPPLDPEEGSYLIGGDTPGRNTVEFACLNPRDAMRAAGFERIDLLKLDIEGFEYGFLDAMLENGIRPLQIAVEFHHFLPDISIWRSIAIIIRLARAGYAVRHKERYDYLFTYRGFSPKVTPTKGASIP